VSDLSIVIVSYRVKEYLRNCLRSVFDHAPGVPFEVLVVDNHSGDGSAEMVAASFPEAILIENRENVGFGRAANQALRRCSGCSLLLLNPDAEVFPSTLPAMLRFMEEHPEAGALGARTWTDSGRTLRWADHRSIPLALQWLEISGFGGWLPANRLSRRAWERDWGIFHAEGPYEVETVSGHCLMTRRETVEQVGLLDERFFMYFEDLDWCRRMRRRGWRLFVDGRCDVVHHLSRSPKGEGFERLFLAGMRLYLRKHHGASVATAGLAAVLSGRLAGKLSARVERTVNRVWRPGPARGGHQDRSTPAGDLHLSWPPVAGVNTYLVEFSASPSFLYRAAREVAEAALHLPWAFCRTLPDGRYFWRVAPVRGGSPGAFLSGGTRELYKSGEQVWA
jgi:O-antigen biosynthesis protein